MASHLTVTSTNTLGVTASKGLNGQAMGETAEGGVLGMFAALLGGVAPAAGALAGQASQTGNMDIDLTLGNLVDLSFGFGAEGDAEQDPEALAAVVQAVVPVQATLERTPLIEQFTALVDALAGIKDTLDAGGQLQPDQIEDLAGKLDQLAEALGLAPDQLAGDIGLAGLAVPAQVDVVVGGSAAIRPQGELAAGLAPLVMALANADASGRVSANAGAESRAELQAISDKLGGILRALNSGALSQQGLAELGLGAEGALDPELEAAIQRLLGTAPVKPETASAPQVPVPALATPQLKLTQSVLTGRPESAEGDAAPAQAAGTSPDASVKPVGEADTADAVQQVSLSAEREPDADQPRESAKPVAASVVPVEDIPDTQAATLTTHQASRIDATAAPRVVQAGYQTSQQQLNLPQIAFELVRQVNDGNTRFQMRLDPPELGRIDVRLDIDAGGKVNARLTVEKAETLDLMQRDQRGLERALQQAGLEGGKTNLEFSLKQNPFGQGSQQQNGDGQPQQGRPQHQQVADEADQPAPTVNLYRGSLVASGVNIIA